MFALEHSTMNINKYLSLLLSFRLGIPSFPSIYLAKVIKCHPCSVCMHFHSIILTVCMPGNLACFLSSVDIFKMNTFEIFFSRKTFRASNGFGPDQAQHNLSSLIWVQTVCKSYCTQSFNHNGPMWSLSVCGFVQ